VSRNKHVPQKKFYEQSLSQTAEIVTIVNLKTDTKTKLAK